MRFKFTIIFFLLIASLTADIFDRATGYLDAGKMKIWGIENYGLLCGYDHPGVQSWYPGAFHGDWGEVRWIAPVIVMPAGPWGAQHTNGPDLPEDRSDQYNAIESFSAVHLHQGDGINFTDWEAFDNSKETLHGSMMKDNIPMVATSTYPDSWPEGYYDKESGNWINTPQERHWPGKWALDPDKSSETYGKPLDGEFVSNQDIFFRSTDKYNGVRTGSQTAKYGYPVGIDMEISAYNYSTALYQNVVFFNINFIYRSAEDIQNPSSPFFDPQRHFYDGTIDSVYFSFFVDPDLPGRYLKPGSNNYQASPWAEDDYGLIYDYDGDGKIDVFLAHDKQDFFTDENYSQNSGPVSAYGINFFKTPQVDPGNPSSPEIGITGFHWFDQDDAMRPSPVNANLEKTFYALSAGIPELVPEERRDLWFHGRDPQMDDISLLADYQEALPIGARPDIQFWFSSGPFSISPGDTIPIHIGIVGGEPVPGPLDASGFPMNAPDVRFKEVFTALSQADSLYENNFIGFRPPNAPFLQAVGTLEFDKTGLPLYKGESGKVRLYWDNQSEKSFEVITRDHDFQGYRLYKTIVDLNNLGETDWGEEVYNYEGDILSYVPLVQYDIIDTWEGVDSFNPWFNMGNNSGLDYEYTDTDVVDGVRYRYTITAYDHPIQDAGQGVLESSRGSNPNLVQTIDIIPGLQAQGYVEGNIDSNIVHLSGEGSGLVQIKVQNPMQLTGDRYLLSFNGGEDSLSLNIYNQNRAEWVVSETEDFFNESSMVDPRYTIQFDGLSLELINHDKVEFLDRNWEIVNNDTSDYYFTPIFQTPDSLFKAGDYLIAFGDSTKKVIHNSYPNAKSVPFQIFNLSDDPAQEHPLELFVRNPNLNWTSGDYIYILEPDLLHRSWQFTISWTSEDIAPSAGDEYLYRSKKYFTEQDTFLIKSYAYSMEMGAYDLKKIKTVPNPYIVSNITEQAGTRADQFVQNMRFTHLPPQCRIRIYTLRGDHVISLHHESDTVGELNWNLQSKENLKISYGVYIYVVDTPEGDKVVKKFAVVH